MNRYFLSLFLVWIFCSCNSKQVVSPGDYQAFVSDNKSFDHALEKVNAEIRFWQNRLMADTGNYVEMMKLAVQHTHRFKLSGQVNDLHVADSFFNRCLAKVRYTEPELYFSIAQNAISQHRFQEAWNYLQLADSLGVNPYVIKLLKFDAAMETGRYEQAVYNLSQIKDVESFDYLIRKAKLEDHVGHSDNAIHFMEMAVKQAESRGINSMILWAKSNLADMYSHAGRVTEAYKKYLDVLQMDSAYLYALKGIAWIAFSHDKNTREAKRILHYILSKTKMPELYLMLADIAEWEKQDSLQKEYITVFLNEAGQPSYGNMYNKYLIKIYADHLHDLNRAKRLAEKEIAGRPTPEAYSWLAWVYYREGNFTKANELITEFVLGKSFEPEVMLHAAFILKESGREKEAKKLFSHCQSSAFELGPLITREIRKNL